MIPTTKLKPTTTTKKANENPFSFKIAFLFYIIQRHSIQFSPLPSPKETHTTMVHTTKNPINHSASSFCCLLLLTINYHYKVSHINP